MNIDRRDFGRLLVAAGVSWTLPGCRDESRYTPADAKRLEDTWRDQAAASGRGPFGALRFEGYRGLADLPWFELDDAGRLRLADDGVPRAIDIHAHLGMSVLVAPELDLHARADRVRHLLDCDATEPGCDLDLDVYINANFTSDHLAALRANAVAQGLWGSEVAATQTIPNLIEEMDATGVGRSLVLPIALGLPFGDDLTERWIEALEQAPVPGRLLKAASVHPRDDGWRKKLRAYAARGALAVKLHPAVQRFYPDDPVAMEIYEECGRLSLPVVFHAGRAGIEPDRLHPYTLPAHFERPLAELPDVQFVLGHAGARDVKDAVPLAARHPNAWLGIHGQGVTTLHEMVETIGPDRLLFGTDWPFYHLAATLAKVLIVTEKNPGARRGILRENAERLFAVAGRPLDVSPA